MRVQGAVRVWWGPVQQLKYSQICMHSVPHLPPAACRQIMNLALLVVSYGVSHRLFEFAWKGQLRSLYPTPALYQVGARGGGDGRYLQLLCCWLSSALGAAGLP